MLQCITGRPTWDHWHDSLHHNRRVLPIHSRVDCSQEQEPNTSYRGPPKFLRERVQWIPMGITPKHAFTIPVTSCEWKKGASALNLKWLKTFTRANMTEDRLSCWCQWISILPIVVDFQISVHCYAFYEHSVFVLCVRATMGVACVCSELHAPLWVGQVLYT